MARKPRPVVPLSPEQSRLAGSCYRLAFKIGLAIGRRTEATPDEIEDLQAAALLGVVSAARTYDPALGFAFSTYATHGAKHHACNERRRQRRDAQRFRPASLEGPNGEPSPLDVLADHRGADGLEVEDRRWDVADLLSRLEVSKPRHAEAVRRRANGERLDDIAGDWGLTRERVRQIEASALALLRVASPPSLDPASEAA